MPDLLHTLQDYDFGLLKMIAAVWGIELDAPSAASALPQLAAGLRQPELIREMVESLPHSAREALRGLLEHEGRLPWPQFERRYGEVRVMGAARREHLRPDLKPATPAEILWYRALIGRAILNLPPEPQQYAYIPDEILAVLGPRGLPPAAALGRAAFPDECAHSIPASDAVLDHACSLLAGLRLGWPLEQIPAADWGIPPRDLQALLLAAGLLDDSLQPLPDEVREFLAAPRAEALALLAQAWMGSRSFNELRLLPGLICEGEWQNDPLQARRALLDQLRLIPADTWWSLSAFIAALKEQMPDFQRPDGDYESWFIRRAGSQEYLHGFAAWDEVEGAQARYLITGPMHWLGFFDLAAPEEGAPPAAFRRSRWADDLWGGNPPAGLAEERDKVKVSLDGVISAPPLAPRPVRYQLARFCAWLEPKGGAYRYRITAASLEQARRHNLRPAHLINLLNKHADGPLPPLLIKALERWEEHGSQARLERHSLLRVTTPEVLAALRKNKRAAACLGEEISPSVALVKPGCEERLLRLLAENGYLAEARLD
jgi:hypothetical protein